MSNLIQSANAFIASDRLGVLLALGEGVLLLALLALLAFGFASFADWRASR